MHYYLDGYNILFRTLHHQKDFKEQRDLLILNLSKKARLLNLHITIVFDGHYHPSEETRHLMQGLEICFTEKGESADEYILKNLRYSRTPKQETVVTSDRQLASGARALLAKTETAAEFWNWLDIRYKNRLLKEKIHKPLSKETSPKKTIDLTQTKTEPLPGSTITDCFEYYLYHFEKKLEKKED